MLEAFLNDDVDPASQLVARYNGSEESSERAKTPALVPEDADPIWSVVVLEKIDEQEGFKLFGTTDSREPENAVEILEQREQKVLFHESTELGRASNLRKSLDWDTAFFTSAGLLDPEELFIINKGFEKVEAHLLPVTQEDLCTRRYADSESTLDSDDFFLDSTQSTEVDLFEEIRAPIEKSNIMSNIYKSVCKSGVGEAHKRKTHSLKKLDDISRNRVKSTPTSRRQSVYMQGSKRVKEDAKKNMVLVGQRKKISLGADHVKMGNKVATLGSGKDLVSKKSGLGNSCCSTSSTTSLESSSSVSVTTSNDSSASCSPSGSASSLKSSSNSRRKADSKKSRLAASSSTSKTPLRMNTVSAGQRKKISLGADHVKMGNKVVTLGSVSVTTSSASSLKSSSNSRRKADYRKSSLAASGSTSKTPLRCGAKQSGQLGSSSQALDGILGFEQANASMISQLASVGKVKKMFAHCLDGTNGGGIFAIGAKTKLRWKSTTISTNNTDTSHFSLDHHRQLRWVMMFYNFPQMYWIGQSGKAVVIDSGTTLAYLADDMFTPLMEKIMGAQPDLKLHTVEQQFTCFQFNGKYRPYMGFFLLLFYSEMFADYLYYGTYLLQEFQLSFYMVIRHSCYMHVYIWAGTADRIKSTCRKGSIRCDVLDR
ncbi:hypothetical protein TEA_004024 [Camellia sinensis var. sinensis]|uniref:Peptidase A1 domain-containing protein n=1 Tax=Camellia sinensis var. sinensis TaxID=542762 RepID=A0A4S4DCT8_CAMSN|nr:hypothetical protein TEA_004024 [Camellia sinensis var. sinensis]